MRSNLNPYTLSSLFFFFHSVAMVLFAVTNVPIKGPNADAGAMVWLMWVWVDFPLGFPAIFVAETASTNVGAIAWLLLIGGFQWAFWGWLLQKAISSIRRSKRQAT
jgi:hypothetical protein